MSTLPESRTDDVGPGPLAETVGALPISDSELAHAATVFLGVDVAWVRPLGGELNRTFRIGTTDGRSVTAKVIPDDAAHRAQLAWQHRLLDRCADRPGLPTPRVLRCAAGAATAPVRASSGNWVASCYSWLPGQIIGAIPSHSDALLNEWGRIAGRLIAVFDGLEPPQAVRRTHEWDLLAAPQHIRRQMAAVDVSRHAQIYTALGWYENVVVPLLPGLPRSVVHHDLNDYNIVAKTDSYGRQTISGVIDFTDALVSARVTEIAIAGAYAMLRKTDPIGALSEVLDGAMEIVELSELEIAAIYPMAVLRLALNAVTWTARSSAAHGGYGWQRSQHTWAALAHLTECRPEDALPTLLKSR